MDGESHNTILDLDSILFNKTSQNGEEYENDRGEYR